MSRTVCHIQWTKYQYTFSSSPTGRDFVAELSNQQAPLEQSSLSADPQRPKQQQHQTQVQIERDDAIETDSLLARREEENRELAQLEQDMTDLVDVFGEVNKLVHEQGEVIGNLWALNGRHQFLIRSEIIERLVRKSDRDESKTERFVVPSETFIVV